jgi:hypothetical protein
MWRMKTCTICERLLHATNRTSCHQACLRRCHCGAKKDHRAAECLSCGMRTKALAQWANPAVAATMRKRLREEGPKRWKRFEDLTWDSFGDVKPDGRHFTKYRQEDGTSRYIYRYQWVWRCERGLIPQGMLVHHKDHDPTNDTVDNLELLSASAHARLHGAERRAAVPKASCPICGTVFSARKNSHGGRKKYCSPKCFYRRWILRQAS